MMISPSNRPYPLTALAALALLAGCAENAPHANIDAAGLDQLYRGHVYVAYEPWWRGPNGKLAGAQYYDPDGSTIACILDHRTHEHAGFTGNHWKVIDEPGRNAEACVVDSGVPFAADHTDCRPLTWDPASGHITDHSQGNYWFVPRVGHFQASWPKAMVQRCPDLELPAGLPVDDKQTSPDYQEMIAQDPDAILTQANTGIRELPPALAIGQLPPLAGTVLVYRLGSDPDRPGPRAPFAGATPLGAAAFGPKGTARLCETGPAGQPTRNTVLAYALRPSKDANAAGLWVDFTDPASGRRWGSVWSRFYAGPDGVMFDGSSWERSGIGVYQGWLQESLPVVFAKACPDLFAGGGLAVNETQRKADYADLKAHADRLTMAVQPSGVKR